MSEGKAPVKTLLADALAERWKAAQEWARLEDEARRLAEDLRRVAIAVQVAAPTAPDRPSGWESWVFANPFARPFPACRSETNLNRDVRGRTAP